MVFACTKLFCFILTSIYTDISSINNLSSTEYCEKYTRLPYSFEVVMLYDIGYIRNREGEEWQTAVIRFINGSSSIIRARPVYGKQAYRTFELLRHDLFPNKTRKAEYITHKICIVENSHVTSINDIFLFISYGVIGSIIIVIFIYIILICVAMCMQTKRIPIRKDPVPPYSYSL